MSHPKYKKVALCLAGGGSRGIYQFGQIQAWLEYGIPYDMLFGTSVGSLNGCILHQNDMTLGEELWGTIKNSDVFHMWPWDIFKPFTKAGCIYDSSPLRNLCKKYINPAKIKSNPLPFYVNATQIYPVQGAAVAYDLKTLSDDEIPAYIKCSANPPVDSETFRGMMLVDGGLVNNFSVMAAIDAGADTIVVMTPTVLPSKKPQNIMDMISIVTSVPEYAFLEREMKFIEFIDEVQQPFDYLKEIKAVEIKPPIPLNIDLLNFDYKQDRKELMKMGYDRAMEILHKELPL